MQYRVVQFSNGRLGTPLKVTDSHTDTSVDIKVDDPVTGQFFDGRERVRIEIFVPRKSDLKIRSGGEIRLDGVSGQLDIDGSESSVNVRDAGGKLHIATSDGRVRVIGFRGDAEIESGDAPISLEGEFASLTTRNENGGKSHPSGKRVRRSRV